MKTKPQNVIEPSSIPQAKKALKEFFRWRNTPFHFRQLGVLFETQFFHITAAQATYELINDGFLQPLPPMQAGANKVTFIVPTRVLSSQNKKHILQSHMKAKAKIISLYDSSEISKDLADHFESLVKHELRANQLQIVAKHPDGRAFGIQAKNELKHIEKQELLEQLEICSCLKIKPVFVVRYMPFTFVPTVTARGGFVLILGIQLYPIGHKKICQQIQDKLSIPESQLSNRLRKIAPKMRTRWPIEVATELPEDASNRLSYWLKTGKMPPRS